MPTQAQILEALQRFQRPENRVYEMVIAKYLSATITAEPMEKTRLVCEAAMMTEELARKYGAVLSSTHKIALSLSTPNPSDLFIAVPWPFPATAESFSAFIQPWLVTMPYPQYSNEIVRQQQEAELQTRPAWEQFFLVTQKLNLSPVALWQLRHEFYTYAMPAIMQITADLSKVLSPASFLAVIGGDSKIGNKRSGKYE